MKKYLTVISIAITLGLTACSASTNKDAVVSDAVESEAPAESVEPVAAESVDSEPIYQSATEAESGPLDSGDVAQIYIQSDAVDLTNDEIWRMIGSNYGYNFLPWDDFDMSWLVNGFCEATGNPADAVVYASYSMEDAVTSTDYRWSVGLSDGSLYEVDTDTYGNITLIEDETDEMMLYMFPNQRTDAN